MSAKLTKDFYGKSGVRLTKVSRRADGTHHLVELDVSIALEGDFTHTYTVGDNTGIVATDSMKNTVYVLAKNHPIDTPESYAIALAEHFASTYPQASAASATIAQSSWHRIESDGKPHPYAFVSGGNEQHTVVAHFEKKSNTWKIEGGLRDLLVLKTTDSAFKGYVRDKFTTLKETDDRIFATSVTATWQYNDRSADFAKAHETIRTALLSVFSTHMSYSVQQTLHAMGEAALEKCPAIKNIGIRMPNKHRLLINLEPFGLKNDNEIFVWTDEPYGDIYGFLERT